MSVTMTSTMRPSASSRSSFAVQPRDDPTYLTLHRMLIRYQNIILQASPRELWSPLPYQRTKWLHNIEYARTLLLQLEQAAQAIKVQSTKRDLLKDLAGKRAIIKRLRKRVEEIGREVENLGEEAWEDDGRGETLEELLGRPPLEPNTVNNDNPGDRLVNGKPVSNITEKDAVLTTDKGALFGARRRHGQNPDPVPSPDTSKTSGFSNLETTERILLNDSRTQRALEESLVDMSVQLKQQALAMNKALHHDNTLINQAQGGLEGSVAGMAATFQNMQWLRRMSEEQGLFGRLKLYGIIVVMWVVLILLVFVAPKLRF